MSGDSELGIDRLERKKQQALRKIREKDLSDSERRKAEKKVDAAIRIARKRSPGRKRR